MDLLELTRYYYETWNNHDYISIGNMFSNNCLLKDWKNSISTKYEIIDMHKEIFEHYPEIKCEILSIHIAENTKSSISELLIHLDDIIKGNEIVKAVNIITFNDNSQITSLIGYSR